MPKAWCQDMGGVVLIYILLRWGKFFLGAILKDFVKSYNSFINFICGTLIKGLKCSNLRDVKGVPHPKLGQMKQQSGSPKHGPHIKT